MSRILTKFQKEFLKEIGKSELPQHYIWSGGTALSYQYLQHRKSYDLDFLSEDLLPNEYLLSEIKKIAQNLKVKKIEEQSKFNRQEFWLKRNKESMRIEFVFYPFPNIKKSLKLKEFGIKIDSIEDILINKIHAIFERAEPKDVLDTYCILEKRRTTFRQILKWVKKKFGVEIDLVLLGSKILEGVAQLNKITPLLLKPKLLKPNKMKKYFENEVREYLKKQIK